MDNIPIQPMATQAAVPRSGRQPRRRVRSPPGIGGINTDATQLWFERQVTKTLFRDTPIGWAKPSLSKNALFCSVAAFSGGQKPLVAIAWVSIIAEIT